MNDALILPDLFQPGDLLSNSHYLSFLTVTSELDRAIELLVQI